MNKEKLGIYTADCCATCHHLEMIRNEESQHIIGDEKYWCEIHDIEVLPIEICEKYIME